MEIVIKLDDELYSFIKEKKLMVMDIGEVCNAIKDGIVLPKGHGKLIDGDALYKLFEQDNFIWEADSYILTAPTIIEADFGCETCLLGAGEQCDILAPSKNCKYWQSKEVKGEEE